MRLQLPLILLIGLTALSVTSLAVPNAPQNLQASISGTTVALEWEAPTGGSPPTEYVLDASVSPGGPAVASFAVLSTAMFVTNVPHGTYYVRVRAVDADGSSAPSAELPVVVPGNIGCNTAPAPPQMLTGSTTANLVRLSWTPPSTGCRVVSYALHAGSAPGASNLGVFDVGSETSFEASAPPGTYYVRVVALNAFGSSVASNEVVVTTAGCTTPPEAPQGLTATATGGAVTLNWTAPSGGCAVTSYVVRAGSAPGLSDVAIINVGTATGLSATAPAGTYYVRVFAIGQGGTSAASNEITITVLASGSVTLGFNGLASAEHGSAVVSYAEAGFTVTPTGADWTVSGTSGRPAPFIQFLRQANEGALTGELTIDSGGGLFSFSSIDVYSVNTPMPVEVVGRRAGATVFTAGGSVPNTFGAFATVTNPHASVSIDAVIIRITNPATPCCANTVGVDNLVLVR